MAVDLEKVLGDLTAFYDFTDKTVISVGAGGGQLVEFARHTRKVLAVDCDEAALEKLKTVLLQKSLSGLFEPVLCDFYMFKRSADVLIFEFSFHEMPDPARALAHARTLAPDVLILDHRPESPWAWQVMEEEKVASSTAAYEAAGIRRQAVFIADQRFRTHRELADKIRSQGEIALRRAEAYTGHENFFIPMTYGLTLL